MPGLTVFLVVVAGVLGLLIGSFLNVVAYRVPAHISLLRESRCPHCGARIKPWQNVPLVSWIALRGRCANCAASISARYPLVEALTAVSFGVVTWWGVAVYEGVLGTTLPTYLSSPAWDGIVHVADLWALALVILAYLYFAAVSIVLTLIDLDTHRLPNSIVLPSYLVAGTLLAVAAGLTGEWTALMRAAISLATLYAFYFVLRLARPYGMGGGDVKLAGLIGIYLGWIGWGALAVGAFAAFLYGGVFGIALMIMRRAGRRDAIPFGHWMIAGAWTGVFVGEAAGRAYTNLFVVT
jgi:leader peptidase (prepilin peptidase)/N-methyltransferase